MAQSLENPILNSPFSKPSQHWALDEKGMPTGHAVQERRASAYVVPIPQTKRTAGQTEFAYDVEGRAATKANALVNNIRTQIDAWRTLDASQSGVTYETARLLAHWRETARDRPLFFCQVEAAETVIWLTEVAPKNPGFKRFADQAAAFSEAANPGLFRLAMKLATGAGKTTVMAMLIAWHAVNKARRPNSKMFTDAFLIIAPGITIRDRLRVLMPEAPDTIYERLSIVPRDMMGDLKKARIVITNYHAFKRRKQELAKGTGEVLRGREDKDEFEERFKETEGQMVQRVMAPLMGRRGIIVINDEAHHCYEHKPGDVADEPVIDRAEEETASEAKADAEQNNEAARVWINGIRTVQRVLDVKVVYDLSATPFFLRGSGYREGELFGWVISDFSLMDAIESGIVKVPRVPTRDDVIQGQEPIFRHIYKHVRKELSRRGRRSGGDMAASDLPPQLEAALMALYRDYAETDKVWAASNAETPPVFIVVCNNTTTSKMVYEWIAGYCENADADEDKQVWKAGNLPMFTNVDKGKPISRRRTILIDSAQLESGDAISGQFKEDARDEVDAFKRELRQRDPSRDVEKVDDAELLREVMNTVGRKGKLGEQVRCVVSVSMLTEGWDANTVTHVLGCRAFGTQLLCEQVVGRALRRVSYDADDNKMFRPEYAEVLGVPFSFMPANSEKDFKPPKDRFRVFTDRKRAAPEIKFPRLEGYRVEFPKGRLEAKFSKDSQLTLSALWPVIPDTTDIDPLVGKSNVLSLGELKDIREQTVAFMLAKRTLERWSRLSGEKDVEPVTLFPQFLRVAKQWLSTCLHLKDGRCVGYLSFAAFRDEAVDRMIKACAETLTTAGSEKIRPIVAVDPTGSSRFVDFHTTRTTLMQTDLAKSQVNYVLWDSTWEAAFAERIEKLERVRGYVKNNGLGFEVPYTFLGEEHGYRPDFIVAVDDGHADRLHVVVEIKGFRGPDAEAKRDALTRLWIPAVNNDGRWGRWSAVEITEPTDMIDKFNAQLVAVTNPPDPSTVAPWADKATGDSVLAHIAERLEQAGKLAASTSAVAA
jgi:type III restriction enzyme